MTQQSYSMTMVIAVNQGAEKAEECTHTEHTTGLTDPAQDMIPTDLLCIMSIKCEAAFV